MTPIEQNRAARQEWLRKGGEDFAARCPQGSDAIGTDGTFISAWVESRYLGCGRPKDSRTSYQANVAARQAYYNSLGPSLVRHVSTTMHDLYMTNTAGQFANTTTEANFRAWQKNQQAVKTMLAENQTPEPESEFTQAEQAAIHSMRSRGFAIVIFTPSELENLGDHALIGDMECRMIAVGNEYIDDHEKE